MQQPIAIRGGWDRLRYAVTFEVLLIGLLAPVLAVALARDVTDTGSLTIVLSVKAMLMAWIYNTIYDRVDATFGRVPTARSLRGRAVHALGFEVTMSTTSLPIVMWWLQIAWWQALLMDLAVMSVVVVYTFAFTFTYDRLFPVPQPALNA